MTIVGTIIVIMFGLVLSIYLRNKEIYNDLQKIKEKLGIEERNEFNMPDEEIEEELERELKDSNENEVRRY